MGEPRSGVSNSSPGGPQSFPHLSETNQASCTACPGSLIYHRLFSLHLTHRGVLPALPLCLLFIVPTCSLFVMPCPAPLSTGNVLSLVSEGEVGVPVYV
ncbi:hypothetical protein JZ751_022900 [Albula glossodonta]|uniref:Uncharacterized protein n=1 Tax=Albula glossodonta TaxID=121402 RepID=A0A8T2PHJ1_9TELE|nr:hypothetical protein JZ751_022900 [Albula glossodonta]